MSSLDVLEPTSTRRLALLIPIFAQPHGSGSNTNFLSSTSNSSISSSPRGVLLLILSVPASIGEESEEDDSFHDLLNHLMQSFEPTGPPPTSTRILDSLPVVKVDSTLKEEFIKCSVCFDDFEVDSDTPVVVKLPCSHIFHKDCVSHWLKEHNTCPNCRYELPVDDVEYEKERKLRMSQTRNRINEEEFFCSSEHTTPSHTSNNFTRDETENNDNENWQEGEELIFRSTRNMRRDPEDNNSNNNDDLDTRTDSLTFRTNPLYQQTQFINTRSSILPSSSSTATSTSISTTSFSSQSQSQHGGISRPSSRRTNAVRIFFSNSIAWLRNRVFNASCFGRGGD